MAKTIKLSSTRAKRAAGRQVAMQALEMFAAEQASMTPTEAEAAAEEAYLRACEQDRMMAEHASHGGRCGGGCGKFARWDAVLCDPCADKACGAAERWDEMRAERR